jgi:hypothetical protein
MTRYQVTLDPQTLQRLFSGENQLTQLLETVLNQVLEAQVSEQLHSAHYERTEEWQGYCNGYKPWQVTTRVGTLSALLMEQGEQWCTGHRYFEMAAYWRWCAAAVGTASSTAEGVA